MYIYPSIILATPSLPPTLYDELHGRLSSSLEGIKKAANLMALPSKMGSAQETE
jgi:hypothetical protein